MLHIGTNEYEKEVLRMDRTTIKCLRKYTGLSLSEFSEQIRSSKSTVNEAENGKRAISDNLRAKVLVRYGDLLDDKSFLAFMSKFI